MQTLRTILTTLLIISSHLTMAAEQPVSNNTEVKPTAMVDIPAGEYIPLYTTDKTPRKVAAFSLDTTSVTKREFLEFVKKNPKWQRSNISSIFADKAYLKDWKSDLDPGEHLDSPVTYISWFAARAYAKSKAKRLPTVDEWEYVARANATKANATSDKKYNQVILSWYGARAPKVLPSPTIFEANFYGVRAMHGLIWEWNQDFNNAMVTGESRGDSGLDRKLFCAAGAFGTTDVSNYAAFMRYAFRSSLKGNYNTANLGFRCAKDLKSKKK